MDFLSFRLIMETLSSLTCNRLERVRVLFNIHLFCSIEAKLIALCILFKNIFPVNEYSSKSGIVG